MAELEVGTVRIRPGGAALLLGGMLLLSGCGSGADSSADHESGPGRYRNPPTRICSTLDPSPFVEDYGTPDPGEDHLLETVRDCSVRFPPKRGGVSVFLDLFADFRPSVEDARADFDRERVKPSEKQVTDLAVVKGVGDAAFAFQEEESNHEVRSHLIARRSNLVITVYLDETDYGLGPDRSVEHRKRVRDKLSAYVRAELAALASP
ncbi:hypothetical protein GCM10010441_19760 [Kitasatospora paracochleata]|uniref:DUF3558 domain-containing protein n=1 Tax=Kitasatospora paracochleata TaxID=58354 RepID=A0ABT1J572_9ACTN|nr:hypothetical protein [Kitasatospora paracochleata]MCP2311891.1 hypothetical protein [Kitasatospora paracochleata]